ncbi:Nif3-like dinuclear metal center hexameric protein [soil metagenome]
MPQVRDLVDFLNAFAPPALAAEWDNTGLLLGDSHATVERLMTCLTITPEVVNEAVTETVSLIVSHHPVLFKGAKSLTSETPEGRLLLPLLAAGIAVYSPHTSFDNCPGGINDGIARRLGLQNVTPLRPKEYTRVCKLVIFLPEPDLAKVSDAVFAAGAGHIGNYSECSFRQKGTGTFFGDDTTHPAVGVKGRREEVAEYRLEVIVPDRNIDAVIAAMRAAHSYEVPAFDIYPLKRVTVGGEGRIGDLATPLVFHDLAQLAKTKLNSNAMQVSDASRGPIRRVALACGAAGEFLKDAIKAKADVFLTGEIRFHDVLTAQAAGVSVIVPGHYATERPGVEDLAGLLGCQFTKLNVWTSRNEREPLVNLSH